MSDDKKSIDLGLMFDQWSDGIIVLDDNFHIVAANNAANLLLGYQKLELIGQSLHHFLCAPSASFEHQEKDCPFHHINDSDNEAFIAWWTAKKGNHVYLDVKASTISHNNISYRLFNFQDCNKRNYSEIELQRLALYAELNPSLIVEFDQDALIHYSNPAMVEQLSLSGFDDDGVANILPKNTNELISQCLTEGKTLKNIETQANGYWFLWNFHPVFQGKRVQAYAIDISQRKQVEQSLFAEKEKFLVTLNSIMDGVITVDLDEKITYVNPDAIRLSGCSEENMLGSVFSDVIKLLNDNVSQAPANIVRECLKNGHINSHKGHLLIMHKEGYVTTVKETVAPMFDQMDKVIGAVIILHDETETYHLEQKLSYQATHDDLTGLINRSEFEVRLKHIINIAYSDKSSYAMLYIDLDNFKIINDNCGHLAGDQLLRQVTDLFKEKLRRGDILARLGGDEFGVILESCPIFDAENIAQEICALVNQYNFLWENEEYTIGVSIGVVAINEETDKVDSILNQADASCYAAKDLGRNQAHVYRADNLELIAKQGEMLWVSRINKALKDDRFILYFQLIQPIFHREGLHFEILIRMLDDNNNIIAPANFLPAAEHYDLIKIIDRWVITQTFSWLANHKKISDKVSLCSINLSGLSIVDPNFIHFVMQQITKNNIDATKICFEITETVAINNLLLARRFIDTLKALGCVFSLDDFGSGMSSFGYLKQLNVDFLKIDGQFVKDISIDKIDEAMVSSINEIGHIMNLKTIAEYVENKDVYDKVKSLGIDFAQGFYIAKPQPLEQLKSSAVELLAK